MRGRKPKPLVLRRLHGRTSHTAMMPDDAPEGVGLIGLPPDWMDAEQKAQWDSVCERSPAGLLTATDYEAVVAFVVATVEFKKAVEDVRRSGQIMISPKGIPTTNPSVRIMNAMGAQMMKTGALLGFSPTARATIARLGTSPAQIAGDKLRAYLAADPDRDRLDH